MGVGQRKGDLPHALLAGHFAGASGEHHVGAPLARAAHFHIEPADALGKPRAERLQHRLLGGEAGGVVHFGVSMGVAIGPLGGRVHLLHEGRRAIDDLAHARDFHDVHAEAHFLVGHVHGKRAIDGGLGFLRSGHSICLSDHRGYAKAPPRGRVRRRKRLIAIRPSPISRDCGAGPRRSRV